MFIINPDKYLIPSYRLSPFRTTDIGFNYNLPNDTSIEDYFIKRFGEGKYLYTLTGRQALHLALECFRLKNDDLVSIVTTSGNSYISSCVTSEIEKFCKWSNRLEYNTKVILLNHEFGYPVEKIDELSKTGIPIIEDCAYAFFSQDEHQKIGNVGEFVIYSFPKMFPIQIGGLMVSRNVSKAQGFGHCKENELKYIKKVLSFYIKCENEIVGKRLYNYEYLKAKLEHLSLSERFLTQHGSVPGVFMFKTGEHKLNLNDLKLYFHAHGVQSSVFYGEDSFFIPVHQALNELDMDYLYEVLKNFMIIYKIPNFSS